MVRGVERAVSGAAVFSAQRFGHRMSLSVYRNPTVLPLAFGRLPATKGTQAIRILAVAAWDAEPGHHVEFLAIGDVNHDSEVNGLDVDPFVDVLLASRFDVAADMNGDGVVNGLDVEPFVAAVWLVACTAAFNKNHIQILETVLQITDGGQVH